MKNKTFEGNPFVAITAVSGGILMSIVIFFLVFAKEMMVSVLPSIVWAIVVLGVLMGLFASRKK